MESTQISSIIYFVSKVSILIYIYIKSKIQIIFTRNTFNYFLNLQNNHGKLQQFIYFIRFPLRKNSELFICLLNRPCVLALVFYPPVGVNPVRTLAFSGTWHQKGYMWRREGPCFSFIPPKINAFRTNMIQMLEQQPTQVRTASDQQATPVKRWIYSLSLS